ncbi:hypothetical protein [Arthrobacter sp. ok362]|uniref:hypothetical protein n=1 Tax=Arthrobacter sp. ok362 TaxID=1761745 RepID=UPI00158802E8|nr:hypothetical protein [Arthrobacter sp. ok362]
MATTNPPTKTMLAAIGRVAGESAIVDDLFRELYCCLIGSPFGRVITAGEDSSALGRSCLKVARYNHSLTDDQIKEIVSITGKLTKLRTSRNLLVHAVWERGSKPGEHIGVLSRRVSEKASGLGTHQLAIWTPTEAGAVADAFTNCGQLLEDFMERNFDEYPYPDLYERKVWAGFTAAIEELTGPD